MPELTITEDQRDYLESLRADLAAEVGPYGHVRERDALQYLIDSHEGALDGAAEATTSADADADGTPATGPTADADGGEESDDAAETDDDTAETDSESDGESDDADRLSSMMRLLDEHDGKWRRTDGDDGTYEVDLPDGGTETVRTKDDVRAVLFKQY